MEPLAHLAGQTAADLQGCPLPARTAAGEVGEHRADEDEGGQAQGRPLAGAHAGNDLVGAAVIFHAADLVEPHNGQARQGHTKEQPGVLPPPCGHQSDGMRKGGPRRPAYHAREGRQHGPVDPGLRRGADSAPEIPRFFSHILPPFTVSLVDSIIFPHSLHCQGRPGLVGQGERVHKFCNHIPGCYKFFGLFDVFGLDDIPIFCRFLSFAAQESH